jgi:aldose 1-epimerase
VCVIQVVWSGEGFVEDGVAGVRFTYHSHDGEEGYPGNVKVSVCVCVTTVLCGGRDAWSSQLTAEYSLSVRNELRMVFSGVTDKATPLNICNHAYWNLSGDFKRDIKGHVRVFGFCSV